MVTDSDVTKAFLDKVRERLLWLSSKAISPSLVAQQPVSGLGLRYRWKNSGRQLDEGELVLIKDNSHHALDRRSGWVLEVYPDSKGIMRQVRLKTAGRDNIHRAVHQLVPLEEEVMVDNISLSPGPMPTGPASIIWGRAKQKRGTMVQAAIVLCLCLLPTGVISWSVDSILEAMVVGSLQAKINWNIPLSPR